MKRRRGSSGIRFIGGREFMLSGRFYDRDSAESDAATLRKEWGIVKVLRTIHIFGEFSCWVHGYMGIPHNERN